MDRKLLKEALLFKEQDPPFSKVRYLFEKALMFAQENGVFLEGQRGSRVKILDQKLFFEFVSANASCTIDSFEKIEKILSSNSRIDNTLLTSNSKSRFTKIFDTTIVLYHKGAFTLHTAMPDTASEVVAIENAESFLDITSIEHLFEEVYFIYLGGFGNRLTKEFLKTKDTLFFIDFDIVSMNFYENYPYKKRLFIPPNIKELFARYANQGLYQKQRYLLKTSYKSEAKEIIALIKAHSGCVEQEIVNATYRSA